MSVRIFFIFEPYYFNIINVNRALLSTGTQEAKLTAASKYFVNLSAFRRSEDSKTPHFLLLGNPVEQSLSPEMHNIATACYGFKARYFAVALENSELGLLASHFNSDSFKGANVTIPYKLMIGDYVDELDESAKAAGAVNTVVKRSGILKGYNTDSYGFGVPLVKYRDELKGGRAIVFGTGGATRAVIRALVGYQLSEIVLVSRKPSKRNKLKQKEDVLIEGYDSWTAYAEESVLIVNATPLGMEPDTAGCPVRESEQKYLSDKICYDIVYKPLQTSFLSLAEEAGARTIPGLEMLIHQGSKSFELWTGKPFPIEKVRNKLHEVIRDGA